MNVHVTICNNLLTGCLIKKIQALIKKALSIYVIETEGAEYSLISKVFFLLCIKGRWLYLWGTVEQLAIVSSK